MPQDQWCWSVRCGKGLLHFGIWPSETFQTWDPAWVPQIHRPSSQLNDMGQSRNDLCKTTAYRFKRNLRASRECAKLESSSVMIILKHLPWDPCWLSLSPFVSRAHGPRDINPLMPPFFASFIISFSFHFFLLEVRKIFMSVCVFHSKIQT